MGTIKERLHVIQFFGQTELTRPRGRKPVKAPERLGLEGLAQNVTNEAIGLSPPQIERRQRLRAQLRADADLFDRGSGRCCSEHWHVELLYMCFPGQSVGPFEQLKQMLSIT